MGCVPLIGARIMRALDGFGMLGSGIRILGTSAICAYEASSGIRIDPGLATTEDDIDLLFDARGGLTSSVLASAAGIWRRSDDRSRQADAAF